MRPFPAPLPIPCERRRVKDQAHGLAASGGAAGVLDVGDRSPVIGAAEKGHAAAVVGFAVVAAPRPSRGWAGPRAAYIPSFIPGCLPVEHGAGSRLAGRVNYGGARAARPAVVGFWRRGGTYGSLAPDRGPRRGRCGQVPSA